jgi:hypothetical protein
MGYSALSSAEFTRRQDLHDSGLHRQGHHFPPADLPRPFVLCIAPMVKKIPGALLVHDVEQRATRDHEYHCDDVRLHDRGRYERRKLSEWIAGEH